MRWGRILRQKGLKMNNIERFTTLKLEFSRVAWYLGNILSALLGREIHCIAKADEDS